MRYLKPTVSVLMLMSSLLCANVMAQSKPEPDQPPDKAEKAAHPPPPAKADAPDKADAPAKPDAPAKADPTGKPEPDVVDKPAPPPRKPVRRRSVEQIIGTMPPSPPLYRPPPPNPPLPSAGMAAPNPPSPVQINSCDAGGCTDVNGTRYNSGAGNATVSPQGRLCTRSGTTMQCF